MITLWGPSSSGKTALLSYLYLSSKKVETDWQIFPTPSSLSEIIRQSRQILRQNEFPLGTAVGVNQDISYDFRNPRTGQTAQMETRDRAGVLSETMDKELLDSLVSADGIVLFLDYARGYRETEVIEALTQMNVAFSAEKKIRFQQDPRPLAVCLSKVDKLLKLPEDLKRLQTDVAGQEQFVRDHLSSDLLAWIDQFHSTVRFFPVSSVGLRLSFGCLQKSVFFDERMALRVTPRGTPINIVEPFIWIFETLAVSQPGEPQ
jgi:hypothetical protein